MNKAKTNRGMLSIEAESSLNGCARMGAAEDLVTQ